MDIGTIIGIIIGLIGITLSIIIPLWYNRQERNIKWEKVLKYVEKIAEELKSEKWFPDILISFPKGGLIVADLLGHQFNNELDIISLYTKRVKKDNGIHIILRHPYVNVDALKGKHILIIDDVISGGETMRKVKELICNVPNTDVRTAVLGFTKPTYFVPNYSAFMYNRNKDLFLPWGKLTL